MEPTSCIYHTNSLTCSHPQCFIIQTISSSCESRLTHPQIIDLGSSDPPGDHLDEPPAPGSPTSFYETAKPDPVNQPPILTPSSLKPVTSTGQGIQVVIIPAETVALSDAIISQSRKQTLNKLADIKADLERVSENQSLLIDKLQYLQQNLKK